MASRRRVWWEPPEGTAGLHRLAGELPTEEWQRRYRLYHDALDRVEMEPVPSIHAGRSFTGLGEEELWPLIVGLADSGCRVPESLLAESRRETPEGTASDLLTGAVSAGRDR